jgi:hypothetical protein
MTLIQKLALLLLEKNLYFFHHDKLNQASRVACGSHITHGGILVIPGKGVPMLINEGSVNRLFFMGKPERTPFVGPPELTATNVDSFGSSNYFSGGAPFTIEFNGHKVSAVDFASIRDVMIPFDARVIFFNNEEIDPIVMPEDLLDVSKFKMFKMAEIIEVNI